MIGTPVTYTDDQENTWAGQIVGHGAEPDTYNVVGTYRDGHRAFFEGIHVSRLVPSAIAGLAQLEAYIEGVIERGVAKLRDELSKLAPQSPAPPADETPTA